MKVQRMREKTSSGVNQAALNVIVAYSISGTVRLAGLIALSDPPREESRHMIETIQSLGIRPIMLTGDDGRNRESNTEDEYNTIRALQSDGHLVGMQPLVFANDFATMPLAKDNASHTTKLIFCSQFRVHIVR